MSMLGPSVGSTRIGTGRTSTSTAQLRRCPANVRVSYFYTSAVSGKYCIDPPNPPEENNLALQSTYNESDPTAIGMGRFPRENSA